jgi:two-component sensor histidine kinase
LNELLGQLFDTSGFPARWHCGRWSVLHGWIHIGSDAAIASAYATISIALVWFVRRRRDLPFPPIFWLFSSFILCCGMSHFVDATIFWKPWYRLSGALKFITAVISWLTVWALIKVVPLALSLPGLVKVNAELARQIEERKRAEREREEVLLRVKSLNAELEERVRSRTLALSASLQERDVLLQEVHHRVKNNFQVVSSIMNMHARRLGESPQRLALDDCRGRIQVIARVHEQLYQSEDQARVSSREYVTTLARDISAASGTTWRRVELRMEIEDIPLSIDRAIPCGLIINELISNALKHAFPGERSGEIHVCLGSRQAHELVLEVRDDGVGIGPEVDLAQAESLGMSLVSTLVEQLEGRLELEREGGTSFRVIFPFEDSQLSATVSV